MANVVGAVWIENWGVDGYRVFLKLGDARTEMMAAGLCEKYANRLRDSLSAALRRHDDLHPVYLRDLVLETISK
jgi:hypothetical protein